MKRFLSLILTFILVFTIGASVVMADEYVETFVSDAETNGMSADVLAQKLAEFGLTLDVQNMQIKDSATGTVLTQQEVETVLAGGSTSENDSEASSIEDSYPGYDESSVVEYVVFDFSNIEQILYSSYITGTEGTLAYYKDYFYYNYGMEVEETEYAGKASLKISTETLKTSDLANLNISYVEEKGFFANKKYYSCPIYDFKSSGYSDGKIAQVYTLTFKDASLEVLNAELKDGVVTKNVIVGKNNSFMITETQFNLVNILIVVMSFVVIILVALVVVIMVLSKKKAQKKALDKDEKFVSEDEIFDKLVEEAGIEVQEEMNDVDFDNMEIVEIEETEEKDEEEK